MFLTVFSILFLFFADSRVLQPAQCANILAAHPVLGKSHWNFMSSILRSLTESGHNVTVFTVYPDGDRTNYTEVDISSKFLPLLQSLHTVTMIEMFSDPMTTFPFIAAMSRNNCELLFESDRMKDILQNSARYDFDLMITEPISSECVSYVVAKLNLPLIYVVPFSMIQYMESKFVGDVPNPATVSHIAALQSVPKTFVQRFANTALTLYSAFVIEYYNFKLKYTDPKMFDSTDPVKPSLLFINNHFITEASRPLSSNVLNVGGIHLKPPERLPNDVLKFIDNYPHGVIYISFGSVAEFSQLPEHIQKVFKDVISQIPQGVLMKYEREMKDKPKNLMTSNWFPQRDILAHPKVKLFVSHGGISGVYEAVDAGVPVLGFPLFYDQPRNIDNLVEAGMALSLDLLTVSKDALLKAVLDLLNNEKYKQNAVIASNRFKDRPMSPSQSVVYWTEYVLRHKGAPHLKSHALNLTWYQYFLLDVIAVVSIPILIVLYFTFKVFKIIKMYCSRNSKTSKVKSQ